MHPVHLRRWSLHQGAVEIRLLSFCYVRQGASAKEPAWAAPKKHRTANHPVCASSLSARDWISNRVHGDNDRLRMNSCLLGALIYLFWIDGGGEFLSHPWGCYVQMKVKYEFDQRF